MASVFPKLYYGLHMAEGVAEYRPSGQEPYRVLVLEDAMQKMDPTFQGKPVYVGHVPGVELNDIQDADGYVVRSFFNQADGKHWCEFLVTTDKGHEAIRKGWNLSNCYVASELEKGGGTWHGVDYIKEVKNAEYEHLAIVQQPRYEESIILTPEQFKKYNEDRLERLKRLQNENETKTKTKEKKSMFNFFKKERVENSADLESMMVELPKSKKQMPLSEVISKYDERLVNGYHCNGDEMIKVGESMMNVSELVTKHLEMQKAQNELDEEKKKNEAKVDEEKKANEDKAKEEEEKKANEAKAEEEKKANEAKKKEEEEKSQNSVEKENFERMQNAAELARKAQSVAHSTGDGVALGKKLF